MKCIIGSDHGGFSFKEEIKNFLSQKGYEIIDCGTFDEKSCDYPDIAEKVCEKVLISGDLGILICGTGIGISISANKISGIRAAVCNDYFSAKYTRLHNDANIICLGERTTGIGTAIEMVDVFLNTKFEAGRHAIRVDKIMAIEKKYCKDCKS